MRLTLILALFLSSCATMPVETQSRPAIERIEIVNSPNGIHAWLVNEPSIPIIAVRMAWPHGSSSDPDKLEGTGYLLSWMMNEGAGDLDSLAYAQRMEELNMSFGCHTGPDWTQCSLLTLSEHRDEAFALLQLALTQPRFDTEPFARAVRETLVAIEKEQTSPGTLAKRKLNASLRPDHPYSRFADADSILAITPDDLRRRHKTLMTRDNMLLAVVGDIDKAELAVKLDQIFADLPSSTQQPPIPEVILRPAPSEPLLIPLPRPQTLVSFHAPAPKRSDKDYIAAYVLNHILGGGGFSSRLMDELREKRGLTYGISTAIRPARHGALWSGQTQTRNESAAEAMTLILVLLEDMAQNGPSAAELEDAKSYLTGAYPLSFASNAQIAEQLMYALQNELGSDYFARRNRMIEQTSLEDLQRLAKKWLNPRNFTFILVGQSEDY